MGISVRIYRVPRPSVFLKPDWRLKEGENLGFNESMNREGGVEDANTVSTHFSGEKV